MKNLKEKVINTIKQYNLLEKGDKVVLGVSGGPDSMCMLDILMKLKNQYINNNIEKNCQRNPEPVANFEIIVAHVNHMIREEASEDETYVRNYCEKNNIEFYSKSIDVEKIANNNKIGTEEAGRLVRYEFFNEILNKTNSNKIAIAHNKNDKIETIIMNLLRGSGTRGLIGIEAKRESYIRPLINCERDEIEKYCKSNNLNPRIDKTNFENIYTRNKIRNVVIPYIKDEFNPNILNTLNRLSELITEEEEYINTQVMKAYKLMVIDERNINNKENNNNCSVILDLKIFNKQDKVIKSKILLYAITKVLGSSVGIEKIHIEDIIKLCENNIGNKYLTPNKNIKVLVKNHKIYFLKQL